MHRQRCRVCGTPRPVARAARGDRRRRRRAAARGARRLPDRGRAGRPRVRTRRGRSRRGAAAQGADHRAAGRLRALDRAGQPAAPHPVRVRLAQAAALRGAVPARGRAARRARRRRARLGRGLGRRRADRRAAGRRAARAAAAAGDRRARRAARAVLRDAARRLGTRCAARAGRPGAGGVGDPAQHPGPGRAEAGPVSEDTSRALAAAIAPGRPRPEAALDVPPDAIAELARRHRVAPLLARRLDEAGLLGRLAPEARDGLRRAVLDAQLALSRLEAMAGPALDALSAAGVPAILLKGAALGTLVYGDPSLRPMTDVDVLVPDARVEDALAALDAAGFDVPDARTLAFWRRAYYNVPVARRDGLEATLEVHWSIAQRGRHAPDVDGLFGRARPAPFAGRQARAPGPADLLLHQALHLSYHYFEPKLIWLYDLALLFGEDPDEDPLWPRARAWGMAIPLALAVLAVERAFPGTVPERHRERAAAVRRARWLVRRLGDERSLGLFPRWSERRHQLVLALLTLDRPAAALRSLASWLARAARFGDRAGVAGRRREGVV
ncbi:MAG: hypothetical protein D6738_10670 [Acidobacteria bacterium]|nr:MAG: hypothetical protein D6738_10670 [Acidobacteriota bacterium]